MDKMRKCIPGSKQISMAVSLLAILLAGLPLFAQNLHLAERLSPKTIVYVEWRGTSFLADADKKNHVLQLMEDPALAPAWLALASSMQKGMQKGTMKQGATTPAQKLSDLISLSANSVIFGIVENPDYSKAADKKTPPVGFFFVYDAKGKKEIIDRLNALRTDPSKTGHTIMHYDFGGTSVEDDPSATDHVYSAEVGGYYLIANLKSQIEDLITRFRSVSKASTSIVDLPEYKETRKLVGTDAVMEMFGRTPNFIKWIPDGPNTQPIVKYLQNLHLDRIHAYCMAVSLAGEAMQMRGELLGDMSPGSILDLIGDSKVDFALQPMLVANSNFTSTRINWAGFYQALRGATDGALTPQQAAMLGGGEGMAQGYLGMSIPDALSLFSGEIGTTVAVDADGSTQQIFASTIQKPQEVLRMLRAMLGDKIASEDTKGNTVYLDITYPYKDPSSGTQRRTPYYVAVGPNAIVAGKRKADVRATIEAINAGSSKTEATGILVDKEFLELRGKFPEKLSGLGATDYRKLPLDKILAKYAEQMTGAAKPAKDAASPDFSWLKPITSDVIARHIHMMVSGTWKDPNGIYFASYFQ